MALSECPPSMNPVDVNIFCSRLREGIRFRKARSCRPAACSRPKNPKAISHSHSLCIKALLLAPILACQPALAQVELPTGTNLSIRLSSELSSKHSQAGEPVSAMLIAPVGVHGKNVLPAGFVVRGTVTNPTPAHKRLNHSVLWLEFGELVGKADRSAAFHARVLDVDNGRESVDSEGVIH